MNKNPKIISFLNQKGGSGKTTLSTNVAHGLVLDGYKVLLVDSDRQGSSRDWNSANEGDLLPVVGLDRDTLPKDLEAIQSGYDIVVIDGAPAIEKMSAVAIKVSDIVLIPVQPSPYDVWATADLVELIKARQIVTSGHPKTSFIISRVIKNTKISREVNSALDEYGFPVFQSYTSQLVMYPSTAAKGLSVFSSARNQAAEEIEKIINELKEKFLC